MQVGERGGEREGEEEALLQLSGEARQQEKQTDKDAHRSDNEHIESAFICHLSHGAAAGVASQTGLAWPARWALYNFHMQPQKPLKNFT